MSASRAGRAQSSGERRWRRRVRSSSRWHCPRRTSTSLEKTYPSIAATWAFLEGGIDVMVRAALTPLTQMARLTEGMSYERYMQLYTVAYNYCISSGMGGGGIAAGAHLVGGELYVRVAQYFEHHLQTILAQLEPLTGEELLRVYAAEWERYTNGANFVHRLLIYLNRHWVKHEREEGRTDVHSVYTVRRQNMHLHYSLPLSNGNTMYMHRCRRTPV